MVLPSYNAKKPGTLAFAYYIKTSDLRWNGHVPHLILQVQSAGPIQVAKAIVGRRAVT